MSKVQNILENDTGAKLVIRWGHDKLVARLDVGKLHYRGEGLTLNGAIEALNKDIEILSKPVILRERLMFWSTELASISEYDASLARKLSKHGLATPAERNALEQLRVKYPSKVLLDELEAAEPAPKARCVKTSGGNLTLEGQHIIEAYCYRCNRSGSPFVINGRVKCSCGNIVAEREETKEARNG